MAGHSKYKNIMYRKGAQDKKRSTLFSKLCREITVAAKTGLPDPDMNPRLRAAITAARKRALASGSGRPIFAATVISRLNLENSVERFLSCAPLRYMMFLYFEWPAMIGS